MQKVAVLAVQFVVAAAASFISFKTYGAAGCAQGDLKKDVMITEAAFATEGYTMGECINMTESVSLSMAYSCKAGILAYDVYESDSCEEATLFEDASSSFDCVDYSYYYDENFSFWRTTACHDDANGYSEYPSSVYNTSDCSGEPLYDEVYMFKDGECVPDAEVDVDTASWIANSYKVTQGDGNFTYESFSSMDCSGTADANPVTCGECVAPDDDFFMTIACPEGTTVDGGVGNGDGGEGSGDGGEGNGDVGEGDATGEDGNATGPNSNNDGAFQPSCIMPVLILLAAGSLKA